MIISPSSRPKHGRARVDSFSKIVTRMLEKYDDVDNKMMMFDDDTDYYLSVTCSHSYTRWFSFTHLSLFVA